MKENIFDLTTTELDKIADSLQKKIEEGLQVDGGEIAGIPTHVDKKDKLEDGRILALDWGGTNFRAAIVEFKGGKATVLESVKQLLSKNETAGFNQEKLHEKMAECISTLKNLDSKVTKIGYCFSYPAASRLNGDAIVLRWNKGIDIPDMINKPVGEPLLKYLNSHKNINTRFESIKVINDTVACLFAGLDELGYDSYIGLIVGTGTNMAGLMPKSKIVKLQSHEAKLIPVNLESGNFNPPYLTVVDGLVDAMSNNKGYQRFEKAISGGYLGELFKTVFWNEKIKYNFDGGDLANIINNPTEHSKEHVFIAHAIYERSAKLVAASLAGFVRQLVLEDSTMKKIGLAADGSVFWSKDKNGEFYYKEIVAKELKNLLPQGVAVTIMNAKADPNLVGSAIAALS